MREQLTLKPERSWCFAVGDGPLKLSGHSGVYYVVSVDPFTIERAGLLGRAWRWLKWTARRVCFWWCFR